MFQSPKYPYLYFSQASVHEELTWRRIFQDLKIEVLRIPVFSQFDIDLKNIH